MKDRSPQSHFNAVDVGDRVHCVLNNVFVDAGTVSGKDEIGFHIEVKMDGDQLNGIPPHTKRFHPSDVFKLDYEDTELIERLEVFKGMIQQCITYLENARKLVLEQKEKDGQ